MLAKKQAQAGEGSTPVPETNKRYWLSVSGQMFRRWVHGRHTLGGWKRRVVFKPVKPIELGGQLYYTIWLNGSRKSYPVSSLVEMCRVVEF